MKSNTYRARRIHRWLGLFIGVQFILWTAGGLYFSWTRLDAVHGDHLLRPQPHVGATVNLVSPTSVIAAIRANRRVDSIVSLDLANVGGRPTYRLAYIGGEGAAAQNRRQLVDAESGELRSPLSREEAIAVATASYAGRPELAEVEYLTSTDVGRHHEYREQPLPAWAVSFGGVEGATLYVPSELGQVHRVRNNRWRTFDFLWMLHTMDYNGRDDFNNIILRSFSLLGLATVSSGFLLFVLTSRRFRRWQHARAEAQRHG